MHHLEHLPKWETLWQPRTRSRDDPVVTLYRPCTMCRPCGESQMSTCVKCTLGSIQHMTTTQGRKRPWCWTFHPPNKRLLKATFEGYKVQHQKYICNVDNWSFHNKLSSPTTRMTPWGVPQARVVPHESQASQNIRTGPCNFVDPRVRFCF